MYACMYVYIYIYIYSNALCHAILDVGGRRLTRCIYIYIERERERER